MGQCSVLDGLARFSVPACLLVGGSPQLGRSDVECAPKSSRQMALITEAGQAHDLLERYVAVQDEVTRTLDASPLHICVWRSTEPLLEQARKVELTQAGHTGERAEAQVGGKIVLDVVGNLLCLSGVQCTRVPVPPKTGFGMVAQQVHTELSHQRVTVERRSELITPQFCANMRIPCWMTESCTWKDSRIVTLSTWWSKISEAKSANRRSLRYSTVA